MTWSKIQNHTSVLNKTDVTINKQPSPHSNTYMHTHTRSKDSLKQGGANGMTIYAHALKLLKVITKHYVPQPRGYKYSNCTSTHTCKAMSNVQSKHKHCCYRDSQQAPTERCSYEYDNFHPLGVYEDENLRRIVPTKNRGCTKYQKAHYGLAKEIEKNSNKLQSGRRSRQLINNTLPKCHQNFAIPTIETKTRTQYQEATSNTHLYTNTRYSSTLCTSNCAT